MYSFRAESLMPERLEEFNYEIASRIVERVRLHALENIRQGAEAQAPVSEILTNRTQRLVRDIEEAAIVPSNSNTHFELYIDSPYAAVHEYGGQIVVPAESIRGVFIKMLKWYRRLGGRDYGHPPGGFLESGTVNMPERPFFRPAVRETRLEIKDIAREVAQRYFRTKRVQKEAIHVVLGDLRRGATSNITVTI